MKEIKCKNCIYYSQRFKECNRTMENTSPEGTCEDAEEENHESEVG